MRNLITTLLLLFPMLAISGCGPEIYKGGCGNLSSTKNTVPYTFGTADGNAYGCYMAYLGRSKNPNYEPLKQMMTAYFNTAAKSNTLTTADGGTVVYVPPVTKK